MKPPLRQIGLTGRLNGLCKRGVIPGFVKSSRHYHKLSTTGSIQFQFCPKFRTTLYNPLAHHMKKACKMEKLTKFFHDMVKKKTLKHFPFTTPEKSSQYRGTRDLGFWY